MKKSLFFCMAFLFALAANAQSSSKLTDIINTDKATFAQAAYLSAIYTNDISDDESYEKAVQKLKEKNILSEKTEPSATLTLEKAAFICAKTVNLKGGLFYTIFKNPRYALIELKAKSIIPALADPEETLTGRDLIALFNGCLPKDDEGATK
ncbi:hypothetical protein [Treponema pectinovorum]|uniref:hypothetical protein n=2 Tax=Treponema pectinovorum TaxID=164 RepID=UPI0011CA3827|nr:hypothetical protein [Treponema pectinovorum]